MRWLRSLLVAAVVAAGPSLLAQELKIGLAAEPSAMDPHFHNLTPNNAMLSHIFERLVETNPQTGWSLVLPKAGRLSMTRHGSSGSEKG